MEKAEILEKRTKKYKKSSLNVMTKPGSGFARPTLG
jgi:hypothetical protein